MKRMTIEELARNFGEALRPAFAREIADGYEPVVVLYHGSPKKAKIRRNADAEKYFKPYEGDALEVRFEKRGNKAGHVPELAAPSPSAASAAQTARPAHAALSPSATRLLRALDAMEADPRNSFVGLKRFRDVILPSEGIALGDTKRELEAAIAAGWVAVGKLNNPNSPFPTATLQLIRAHPAVQAVLQASRPTVASHADVGRGFAPRDLGGISVSEIVLAGRR